MGKQMDRGGSLPQRKDIATVLNQLLLNQRLANQSRSSLGSTAMPTRRSAPAKKQRG